MRRPKLAMPQIKNRIKNPIRTRIPRVRRPRLVVPDWLIAWTATLLTPVWGLLWAWSALTQILGEEQTSTPIIPLIVFAIPLIALSLTALVLPRIGGLLIIPCAIFGAWFFDDPATRMLLATPTLAIGATLVWMGPWKRSLRLPRARLPKARLPGRRPRVTTPSGPEPVRTDLA